MKKRNRRTTRRHSVAAATTFRCGAIVLLFFVMVIFNMISSSRCTQLVSDKCKMEREIARLDEVRRRESSRWEEMKTPEKIEMAMIRHGLKMSLPRFDQTIRVDRKGQIPPGQIAVARAKQRNNPVRSASYRSKR